MDTTCKDFDTELQLIGEFDSPVMPLENPAAQRPAPGEPVVFEPGRADAGPAMLVRTGCGDELGCLPQSVARWLVPMIEADRIRLVGHAPARAHPEAQNAGRRPWVRLGVFVTPEGQCILRQRSPRTRQDALHELVRSAYEQVQHYKRADLVLELADAMRWLACQPLLPETHLLLALLPGIAREIRHVEAMLAQPR